MSALATIFGVGAFAPNGLDAMGVTMAARARRFEPRSIGLRDASGEAIGAHVCRALPEDRYGWERLVRLAAPALREALSDAGIPGREPVTLLLAAGEEGRPDAEEASPELLDDLALAAAVEIDRGASRVIRGGNAGFAQALAAGLEALKTAPFVLVGGVDSLLHPAVLSRLDDDRRLLTAGRDEGLVPSEGAAFFVLGPAGAAQGRAIATVTHVALGLEYDEIDTAAAPGGRSPDAAAAAGGRSPDAAVAAGGRSPDAAVAAGGRSPDAAAAAGGRSPDAARAMTALVRGARSAFAGGLFGWILTDVNAERHRQREHALVRHRIADLVARGARRADVARPFTLEEAPREFGDTGAATGALMLAVACGSFRAGVAPAESVLCTLSSDGGGQAASGAGGQPAGAARAVIALEASPRGASERAFRASVGEPAVLSFARPEVESAEPLAGSPRRDAKALAAELRGATEQGDNGLPASAWTQADVLARWLSGEEAPGQSPRARGATRRIRGQITLRRRDFDQIRALLRSTMEDIAALGVLRARDGGRPWAVDIEFDQRLLDNLDAFGALGRSASTGRHPDLLDQVLSHCAELPLDRGRAFLRTFTLACTEGPDAAREAVFAIAESDPRTLGAHRTALCLGSSPAVVPAVRELLDGGAPYEEGAPRAVRRRRAPQENPRLTALGLDVLRFRGEVRFADVATLAFHPSPDVVWRALLCLGTVPEREAARGLLGSLLEEPLRERALLSALESGLRLGLSSALPLLRDTLAGTGDREKPHGTLTQNGLVALLAIAGDRRDVPLLLGRLDTPAAIESVGFHGSLDLVDPLIERLGWLEELPESARPARAQRACAEALGRILGTSEAPRAAGETESPRAIEGSAAWEARWRERQGQLDAAEKMRFGAPFELKKSLAELSDPRTVARARRMCELEISMHLPEVRLQVNDWVAPQRRALAKAREGIEALPDRPGLWPMDRLVRLGGSTAGGGTAGGGTAGGGTAGAERPKEGSRG